MRVLVIKTSSMGDVIHTLPALTDAAKSYPDIVFDWVVEEAFAEIPAWHPAVDTVIPVAIRRWRKQPFKTLRGSEWKNFRAQLKRHSYDAVIDAQGLLKSACLSLMSCGPRYGYDRRSIREPLAALMYPHHCSVGKDQHAVERIRQLFAHSLSYPLPDTVGNYGIDKQRFAPASCVDANKPYLVFLHGTTRADKHWPEPYWRELTGRALQVGCDVYLPWGNDVEKARANRLVQSQHSSTGARAMVLPKLNLAMLAGVIAGAQAVVAVDTGLGHLSAALDIPSVSLYGSTSPKLIGAYGRNQIHLCAANYRSLENVSVEPAVFATLTPALVWQQLAELIGD